MIKIFYINIVLVLTIVSCGQTGKLYLNDAQKIHNIVNPKILKKINQRIIRKQQLSTKIQRLLKQEQILKSKNKDFQKIRLKRLEAEYELGQIQLSQQLEGYQSE